MNYQELTRIRHETIDDVHEWLWITKDNGAWDGPKQDWITSHKEKYLKYTTNKRVCIQAGGNQGMYPRLLSFLFETVYTFEPDPLNYYCLVNNCQSDNIIKIQGALGDKRDLISVHRICENNTGMHKVTHFENNIIPQFTIDSFNLNNVDLIALDTEGYEFNIIKGAMNTIERCNPVVICENGNSNIVNLLSTLNYTKIDQSVSDTIYYKY